MVVRRGRRSTPLLLLLPLLLCTAHPLISAQQHSSSSLLQQQQQRQQHPWRQGSSHGVHPDRSQLLNPQRHFGTYRYEIPGLVASSNGTSSSMLLHIFLRALATGSGTAATASGAAAAAGVDPDSSVELRGFFYGEAVDEFQFFGTIVGGKMVYNSLAEFDRDALPRFALRAAAQIDSPEAAAAHNSTAELVAPVAVGGEMDVRLPLTLTATGLTRGQLARAHWLAVEGWPRAAALGDLVRHVNLPAAAAAAAAHGAAAPTTATTTAGSQPRVLFVSYPLWGVPDDQKRLLLKVSVEWHARVGLAGHVQYAPSAAPYAADAQLAAWVGSGRLQLVSWRSQDHGLAKPLAPGCDRYDKPLLYNHALLSHWGSGAHLFIADVDEFLATPAPPGVTALLSGGADGGGCLSATRDQAKLRRKDVACAACHANRANGANGTTEAEATTEWDAWARAAAAVAAATPGMGGTGGVGSGAGGGAGPGAAGGGGEVPLGVPAAPLLDSILPMYDRLLRGDDHVKSLVDPDAVRQFHVHNGPVAGGQPPRASPHTADPGCAFVVHAKHLYGSRLGYHTASGPRGAERDSLEGSYSRDVAWQWPLQQQQQQQQQQSPGGGGGGSGSGSGGMAGGGGTGTAAAAAAAAGAHGGRDVAVARRVN